MHMLRHHEHVAAMPVLRTDMRIQLPALASLVQMST